MVTLLLSPAFAAPPTAVQDVSGSGRYFNKISNVTLIQDFVEICFTGTGVASDVHVGGGSSLGGNCVPGVTGYILELIPRSTDTWASARGACLGENMRLPEPFELQFACEDAVAFGFGSNFDATGWASNDPTLFFVPQASVQTYVVGQNCVSDAVDIWGGQQYLCAL
jgi:hypothetical protein